MSENAQRFIAEEICHLRDNISASHDVLVRIAEALEQQIKIAQNTLDRINEIK